MLQPLYSNPKLSAYTILQGVFDLNKRPMAPPGNKVQVHKKAKQQLLWNPHSLGGWHLSPAPEYYHCYCVYITKKQAKHHSDTVEFFLQYTAILFWTPKDVVIQATKDILHVLHNPLPTRPYKQVGQPQLKAVKQLHDIYNNKQNIPNVTPNVPLPRVEPDHSVQQMNSEPTYPCPTLRVEQVAAHWYPTQQRTPLTQEEANSLQDTVPAPMMPTIHHGNAIIDPKTGASVEYWQLMKSDIHQEPWQTSFANKLGQLAQGVGNQVKDTDT